MSEEIIFDTCCEVNNNPSVKDIMGANYGLLVELESVLMTIADGVKKSGCPGKSDNVPTDLISALDEHNKLLCRCLDHARYISNTLGV